MEEATKKSVYRGKIECSEHSGDSTFIIDKDGLVCSLLFDDLALSYEDVDCFSFGDYSLRVTHLGQVYRMFAMGQHTEWLYNELYTAFNKKVLAALGEEGSAVLCAQGLCDIGYGKEQARIEVYEKSVCILPANRRARRYPFFFLNGLKEQNYAFEISLSTGEKCAFSMLGHDYDPLIQKIKEGVMAQKEQSTEFLKELCPALALSELSLCCRYFAEGIAAPLAKLPPALKALLLTKAKNSKMGSVYPQLISIADGAKMAVGLVRFPEEKAEELIAAYLNKLNANSDQPITLTPQQEDAFRWIVWAALPSKDGKFAIVEFAIPDEGAATYVFKMDRSFDEFLPKLNRALEATNLAREVFSAPANKLSGPMKMLLERTPVITRLRELYVGKAIHRSVDSWQKSVLTLITTADEPKTTPRLRFCTSCGAALNGDARFCGQCGAPTAPTETR